MKSILSKFLKFTLIAILSLIVNQKLLAQISPGDLAKVHSHLEGMSNCTKCHILGEKVTNAKCLACHTAIKTRIDQNKGYHSSAGVKTKQCAACHNDHHGVNFQIIKFDKAKFDHKLTGYTLSGAHSKKKCEDCHKPEFIQDVKLKAKKTTYLGLKTDCQACHADYHQKTLSSNCADCHNNEKFKPAPKFDHRKAKYQLTGKHQSVACVECHKISNKNGQKYQEFKGLQFTSCSSCHMDVHNNKFGQKCADCHNTESFAVGGGVKGFDHNKTDFKLEGKHQNTNCKSCHKLKLTTPLNHKNCRDCHVDYHEGQFTRNKISPDCSECHSVNGFPGSSYSIEKHQLIYPLQGAHLATPCFACHKKTDKWKFKNIGKVCADCHDDIHKGLISEKYYAVNGCQNCHTPSKWSLVQFNHDSTRFALKGAHQKKTCRDCHFNKQAKGHDSQRFSGLLTSCSSCHKDIHQNQFVIDGTSDCSRCHNQSSFLPADGFDHNNTRFKLDGKHNKLPCGKCHKSVEQQGVTFILYKLDQIKCEDCHR